MFGQGMRWRRRLGAAVPLLVFGLLLAFALQPWLPGLARGAPPRTIIVYGFSVLGETMTEAIFPAFRSKWLAETGEAVEFISAFAGSGTVTNQLIMGVPADMALLSLELDAERLAKAGVVAPDSWRQLPHHGVVNRTPFVILVRQGNPKGIHDFEDLAKPGVGVVHPDPLTSGGANWAVVAEYGAGARAHPEDPGAGHRLLAGIWRNVVAQAASARAARTQFENGFGDALITYEQEALFDRQRGKLHSEIVYPKRTILSEHTLLPVPRHVDADEASCVAAFEDFLWSDEAQELFVARGFRSVDEWLNDGNAAFGHIDDAFTIEAFGGWTEAKRTIVDGVWAERVLKELGQ